VRKPFIVLGLVIGVILLLPAVGVGASIWLENQNSFCASCHTEPETKYYQQSLLANPATLAAFHSQKKILYIDCHSGAGPLGRAQGLQQGVDDLVIYLSGNYHKPGITSNPLGDDSCLKCHENIDVQRAPGSALPPVQRQPPVPGQGGFQQGGRNRRQTDGHYHQFLQRWQANDPRAGHCVNCHSSHSDGTTDAKYIAQNQVQQVCNRCHTALNVRD
jgi:predicted CXXCH cytochrome family protein